MYFWLCNLNMETITTTSLALYMLFHTFHTYIPTISCGVVMTFTQSTSVTSLLGWVVIQSSCIPHKGFTLTMHVAQLYLLARQCSGWALYSCHLSEWTYTTLPGLWEKLHSNCSTTVGQKSYSEPWLKCKIEEIILGIIVNNYCLILDYSSCNFWIVVCGWSHTTEYCVLHVY